MSIGPLAVCLVALSASVAVAQTPPVADIQMSRPDEVTVELPKNGPPMVDVRDDAPPMAVIPAGQEDLFAEMLGRGAALAGGCALSAGQIDGTTARATYNCPAGEVVFELVHPDQAGAGATNTGRFAIVRKSGTAPDGFVVDLASRIRAREGTFEWKWLGTPRGSRSFGSILYLAAGAAVAIVAVIWVLRALRLKRFAS